MSRKNGPERPARSAIRSAVAALPGPVGMLGYGTEGRETLRFLRALGRSDLLVLDRHYREDEGLPARARSQLEVHSGEHYAQGLTRCGTIFRSPGIRPDLPDLTAARRSGTRITSATRFFLSVSPARSVGVTGTVGKGTTVTLIGEALRQNGVTCHLGGNIGTNPLAFLPELTAEAVVVLELSSFQLMDLEEDQPEIAVVLRTSTEHLDWHVDVAEYRRAKAKLLARERPQSSGQHLIFCEDSAGSREIARGRTDGVETYSLRHPVRDGVGLSAGGLARFRGGDGQSLPGLAQVALPGAFNLENIAAALLAAEWLGVANDRALPPLAGFGGLPHRLERIGAIGGVECINDSYATRPEAALGALRHYRERPLALILGGSEKQADFTELMDAVCGHPALRVVLFIGATAERMVAELIAAAERSGIAPPAHGRYPDLAAAVGAGLDVLGDAGVLLLSPACASFGLFPNYKVRGESFRELVQNRL